MDEPEDEPQLAAQDNSETDAQDQLSDDQGETGTTAPHDLEAILHLDVSGVGDILDTNKLVTRIDTRALFPTVNITGKLLPTLRTQPFLPVINTTKIAAGLDTSKWVTAVDTGKLFPRVDVKKLFPLVDTRKLLTGLDTSKWVTAVDTGKLFPRVDVKKLFPLVDTRKLLTGLDTSKWVTAVDTGKLFAGLDLSGFASAVDWKRLVADVDWHAVEDRISDVELDLDQALDDELLAAAADLASAVERLELEVEATGEKVTKRQTRVLAIVALAVYITFALALHISHFATTERRGFDVHQFITDQSVAIGLGLAVYGTFKKE